MERERERGERGEGRELCTREVLFDCYYMGIISMRI